MANGVPSVEYLRRFAVNLPGQPEVIRQMLYDHELYPGAGGITQLNFFQNPIGQGVATALGAPVGSRKTKADTNMTLSGQLSTLLNFVIQKIMLTIDVGLSAAANTYSPAPAGSFDVAAAVALQQVVNDVETWFRSGWLELQIGNKLYLTEAPLAKFPPATQTIVDAAVSSNSATVGITSYRKAFQAGRPYFVDPALSLMSNQNFVVTLNWPGSVAMPSGFNARIGCHLDGVTFRAAQ
jgi:hypothetical protein